MGKAIAKGMEEDLPDRVRHAPPRQEIAGKDVIVARAAEELAERFTGYDDQKHDRGRRRRSVEREDLLQVNSDQALEMQERLWRLSWHR